MKIAIDIPETLFQTAKAIAVERGVPLNVLVKEAIRTYLARNAGVSSTNRATPPPAAPPWTSAFGGLRNLRQETKRINRVLQREFEQIEHGEWR